MSSPSRYQVRGVVLAVTSGSVTPSGRRSQLRMRVDVVDVPGPEMCLRPGHEVEVLLFDCSHPAIGQPLVAELEFIGTWRRLIFRACRLDPAPGRIRRPPLRISRRVPGSSQGRADHDIREVAMSTPNGSGPLAAAAAPRATEQLIAAGRSAHDIASPRRPARDLGYELRGLSYVPVSRQHQGRFGRMFRLPPYVPSDARIADIAARMIDDVTPPAPPGTRPPLPAPTPELDNPAIPAGYTYLGQKIDHDLSFDPVSSVDRQNDPDALVNFRSPRFDLDSLYGRGPVDDPFLYDKRSGSEKLIVGHHDDEDDLPRNDQGTALIGDPRDDENIFVSQLHLTFLKFHNAVVDEVRTDPGLGRGSETTLETAQRLVRWHYQWLVVHDFLRRIVGDEMLRSVLDESGPYPKVRRRFFRWRRAPFLPVEFSVAAYRFGHSTIRGAYTLNTLVGPLRTFLPGRVDDPANLLRHFGGFRTLPRFWTIEWARFFPVDGAGKEALQPTRRIDTRLADPLADLPVEIAPGVSSLIVRNLTRGARLLLPSGQDVARRMRADVLADGDLGLPGGGPSPLWYYVLREAQVQAGGRHLGQVGGRIVAEVFLGLLENDPSSYVRLDPGWTPFLPSATPGDFTMPDLIAFAGHGLDAVTPAPPPGG